MSNEDNVISAWSATELVIPNSESAPDAIVRYASPTLSKRDMQSIVSGFQSESYEMVVTFVWAKAAAALKKQVASLGMEFVGEMLGRPDLHEDSDPATSIADHEVISLAEDLAIITPTQGLRLKHALELISHFSNLGHEQGDDEAMQRDEAISILKACISSTLGHHQFTAANQFAAFRRTLAERDLRPEDADVQAVANSPYFFVRTTLSVLLSLVKGEQGAILEHAIGNTSVLLPMVWDRLKGPERWQVGQAYAEVNAAGNRQASAGLKRALLDVHGFDYVPESLRSSAFTEAAARVLSAHFATNNFYNETAPMSVLANLGTAIPMPAFAKCMEATLAVWLGNPWGFSWLAEKHASRVLDSLRPTQWEFYINECLPRDRTVLDKLSEGKPKARWQELVGKYVSSKFKPKDKIVDKLLTASRSKSNSKVKQEIENRASELRQKFAA
jgi:hypothetical protein